MRGAGWVIAGAAGAVVVLVVVAVVLALRPLPAPSVTARMVTPGQPGPASISWPEAYESSVTVDGLGKTWTSSTTAGGQAKVSIASVAKMMTAYVVLRDHPLSSGEQGPVIPVTEDDADEYQASVKAGDSSAKVAAGESLTERQALEALLLPSADNVAWILAEWDAGSRGAFTAKMNMTARSLGMDHTDYTDPSGLSASTVSTASDQLALVRKAMAVPVFASIVAMPSATIPVAGTIRNYNSQTGRNGVIGVKTGSDSSASGCWAFAIKEKVGGAQRVVYGVVLGSATLGSGDMTAILDGEHLASEMPGTVRTMTVLPAGTPVGSITVPWSKTPVTVVTARALSGLVADGTLVTLSGQPRSPATSAFGAGAAVGTMSAGGLAGSSSSTPLVTASASGQPSLLWRVFR